MDDCYRTWLSLVDRLLSDKTGGMTSKQLDAPYANWFNDGMTPEQAALDALYKHGFFRLFGMGSL